MSEKGDASYPCQTLNYAAEKRARTLQKEYELFVKAQWDKNFMSESKAFRLWVFKKLAEMNG